MQVTYRRLKETLEAVGKGGWQAAGTAPSALLDVLFGHRPPRFAPTVPTWRPFNSRLDASQVTLHWSPPFLPSMCDVCGGKDWGMGGHMGCMGRDERRPFIASERFESKRACGGEGGGRGTCGAFFCPAHSTVASPVVTRVPHLHAHALLLLFCLHIFRFFSA
jgi:hypothetical protein